MISKKIVCSIHLDYHGLRGTVDVLGLLLRGQRFIGAELDGMLLLEVVHEVYDWRYGER